jgi:hypothetical protein
VDVPHSAHTREQMFSKFKQVGNVLYVFSRVSRGISESGSRTKNKEGEHDMRTKAHNKLDRADIDHWRQRPHQRTKIDVLLEAIGCPQDRFGPDDWIYEPNAFPVSDIFEFVHSLETNQIMPMKEYVALYGPRDWWFFHSAMSTLNRAMTVQTLSKEEKDSVRKAFEIMRRINFSFFQRHAKWCDCAITNYFLEKVEQGKAKGLTFESR